MQAARLKQQHAQAMTEPDKYMYMCMCIHTYIHIYMQAYRQIDRQTDRQTIHTYVHTYIHTYVHTYITYSTYITYIRYIHTYIHTYSLTASHRSVNLLGRAGGSCPEMAIQISIAGLRSRTVSLKGPQPVRARPQNTKNPDQAEA